MFDLELFVQDFAFDAGVIGIEVVVEVLVVRVSVSDPGLDTACGFEAGVFAFDFGHRSTEGFGHEYQGTFAEVFEKSLGRISFLEVRRVEFFDGLSDIFGFLIGKVIPQGCTVHLLGGNGELAEFGLDFDGRIDLADEDSAIGENDLGFLLGGCIGH